MKKLFSIFLVLLTLNGVAQYHGFTLYNLGGGIQALVMRPHRADTATKRFPLVLVGFGLGETGTDPTIMFNIGVGRAYILDSAIFRNQYDSMYTVMFLPSSNVPQFSDPANMKKILDFASATCTRSDTTNWMYCGISQGSMNAAAAWSDGGTVADSYQFRRVSKFVFGSTCASGNAGHFQRFFQKGSFLFMGDRGDFTDGLCSTGYTVDLTNNLNAGGAYTKTRILNGSQYTHSNTTWDVGYRPLMTDTTVNNMNIYKWLFNGNSAAGNIPPVSNAGSNQNITQPTSSTTLTGSGTDADGTITGYLWTKFSGPACTITSPSSATTGVTGMSSTGVYTFQLTVTDNNGATNSSSMTVTVAASGALPPIVTFTSNHDTITLPVDSIVLSSVGTTYPGSGPGGYLFQHVGGPVGEFIQSPASFFTKVFNLLQGTHIFRLTVTAANGQSAFKQDTVVVLPAALPPNCVTNLTPANGVTLDTALNTATLTWNAAGGGTTSYDVKIWLNGGSEPGSPTYNTASTSQAVTGLSSGLVYRWYIIPKNANGSATGCSTNYSTFQTSNTGAFSVQPRTNQSPKRSVKSN